MSAGFDKNGKPIIDVSDLQAKIKEYGDKVKALKAEKKPKDDPELVAAINALNKAKEELAEVTKPVETNPFAKCRAELEDITKRRFFYRPAFDIYGGTAGFYTYGPPGSALKANIQALWRKHFIIEENLMEIEDPTITPYDVLKTSGHVDRFNDFMVKDSKDDSKFFRADKLLEEELENRLKVPTCSDAERTKYKQDMLAADSFTREQLHAKLQEYGVKAPESGNDLTEPYAFNLMFPTPIGPSGLLQGYLRPETAQGIFLNYKYCAEQNAEKMPFGVAQIGKSYRNEIAPRGGLVRQREFTQAEIEFFCRPKNKDFEKFVATGLDKLELNMLPSPIQLAGQDMIKKTLGAAVKEGTIANETLAYFIGRTALFLLKAGIKMEHLRFRQHLPTEMAHYACDCWDAEIEVSTGWMETVGIADRSAYDLTVHSERTKVALEAQDKLETPISVEVVALAKKAGALMGKDFRTDAPIVKGFLESLSPADARALQAEVEAAGSKDIAIDGKSFTVKKEHATFDIKIETRHMESYTPHVIEPSFGIDRVFTAVLEHSYYSRPQDPEDKEKINRGVLALTPDVAPYKVIVMPLDQKVGSHAKYLTILEEMRAALSDNAINYKVDDSGASVGKRYARNDELGVPLAITIDYQSIGQSEAGENVELEGTVTIRERDSCSQVRVPVSEAVELVVKFITRGLTWSAAQARYAGQKSSAAGGEGAATPVQAEVEAYLSKHKISDVLNACLNETLAARPENPLKHLAALLAAKAT